MDRSYSSGDHDLLFSQLGISPDARILDVGGGANPFRFASVVVDMDYGFGNSHRDGSAASVKRDGSTYVQADIHSLPFKDNSFDFVICLHVLEHVDSPARACQELMRVAKAGFLETPRKWTEYYAGHPTHRWLVDSVDGCLTFEPVTYNDSPFMNFALPPLWDSPELQKRLFVDFSNIPCVQIAWDHDGFSYKVEGDIQANSHSLSSSLPAHLKTSEFLAESHYCFARNLLLWMGQFETGAFHAATACKMVPEKEKYQTLYLFYTLLTISLKDFISDIKKTDREKDDRLPEPSWRFWQAGIMNIRISLYGNHINSKPEFKIILAALLCRALRFLTLRALKLFRKLISVVM
ncbi:MAG: class I SAM-dependent methyltransferase [Desulfamplus sp.]|nr:class I SAM-dependent methyltransferase [Desulfamplus sp.]